MLKEIIISEMHEIGEEKNYVI